MSNCNHNHDYPIVVLASGQGSNLNAIIEQATNYRVVGVISDKPDAGALEVAKRHDIPSLTQADTDVELLTNIQSFTPQLVVLAGFMRVLGPNLVANLYGRLINIHPSLLPKYPGLHTYQQVLANGDSEYGCTVHFVDEKIDNGPIIMQAKLPVTADDTVHSLRQRLKQTEYLVYSKTIELFASGKITLNDNTVLLGGQSLPIQGISQQKLLQIR